MTDAIWNSDKWTTDPSDVFSVDDRDGYLKNVRIHKFEDGKRVMYCQLFRVHLETFAELTIALKNESDRDAIEMGMGALQYIISVTHR